MAYPLGDIFVGSYPLTQAFGARPEIYSARYNLRGHNGTDFGCPSLTPVLATAEGFVSETGFDAGGYGRYIKIVHDGYLTLYAHLNDTTVQKGDRVIAGQLIAHSNNTGFSDAPHLHFGVAPCDQNGIKTDPNNGYSGYIDPMSSTCVWTIRNLSEPITVDQEQNPPVQVPFAEFPILTSQATNYKIIATYLQSKGLNDYLNTRGDASVDLANNLGDPKAGEKCVSFLSDLFQRLQTKSTQPVNSQETNSVQFPNVNLQAAVPPQQPTQQQQEAFLHSFLSIIRGFIFTQQ